jgi:hypothetical protein
MARDEAEGLAQAVAVERTAAWLLKQASELRNELAERSVSAANEADALARALAEANERTEAVRSVLMALVSTLSPRAIKRREFQEAVRKAAADVPDNGPQAVRHAVLLEETRRVLGVKE